MWIICPLSLLLLFLFIFLFFCYVVFLASLHDMNEAPAQTIKRETHTHTHVLPLFCSLNIRKLFKIEWMNLASVFFDLPMKPRVDTLFCCCCCFFYSSFVLSDVDVIVLRLDLTIVNKPHNTMGLHVQLCFSIFIRRTHIAYNWPNSENLGQPQVKINSISFRSNVFFFVLLFGVYSFYGIQSPH